MNNVLVEAIDHYGKDMQQHVAIEELSELQKEICKFQRGIGNKLHLAEEIADAEIMIEQLKIIHSCEGLVQVYKSNKIERLHSRIEYEKKYDRDTKGNQRKNKTKRKK